MPENLKFVESKIKLRSDPRIDDDDTVDLAPYIFVICERWLAIAAAAVVAAAVTAMLTGFVLPKWYRASAVIRPIATPAVESRIAGVLGGLGGGFGGLGGLAASIGAGGNNDAEEYIAIMQGFEFNITLSERHHISTELLKPGLLSLLYAPKPKDVNWAIYRALKKRFECDYSIKTGNLTLYFEARNRRDAENVLGYYIHDLRDLLRAREISGASAAIDSVKEEANSTPDALLRSQLYDLVAKQVQRKKMAQVEADFAFRVLDPPAASDKPYGPWVLVDSMLAAFLSLVVAVLWVAALRDKSD